LNDLNIKPSRVISAQTLELMPYIISQACTSGNEKASHFPSRVQEYHDEEQKQLSSFFDFRAYNRSSFQLQKSESKVP
jgi:hypothetical protein